MFNRDILGDMRKWAAGPDRKPLILKGARQVGKTTAVELFSKRYDHYIYLNLEKSEDAAFFSRSLPFRELLQAILLARKIPYPKGRALLFIDEIQNSPEAVKMLRYFYESAGDLHVVAAGSLLEIMMRDHLISFPVGRVQYMFMFPLTFAEFLLASGENQAHELYNTVPLPDFSFPRLLDLFHKYVLIGGMPEIVAHYMREQDIGALIPYYQGLITSYMDDVSKYARNPTMVEIIRHAIESAPLEAGKRIRFHGFGQSSYRSREMGEALRALERAMLVYLIYPSTSTELPIIPDKKKSPKLQFIDTGLVNFFAGLQDYFFRPINLHGFYNGIIAEHVTGQELLAASSFTPHKVMFWVREKKQSNAEVDFLVQHREKVVPVEVKSGATGSLRSLHQFIERSGYPYAVRLWANGVGIDKDLSTAQGHRYHLLNLPYFLTGKLHDYLDWLSDNAG